MEFRKIDEQVSVAGQILPEDITEIVAAGFRGIICNRPDNEAADQPDYDAIKAAADAAGIPSVYIPIIPGLAGADEVDAFRKAVASLPGPVLAYCRSGARSGAIYEAARP